MPPDATSTEYRSPITVITATWLETWVARLVLRRSAPVLHVGVGAIRPKDDLDAPCIVCGLAGALSQTLKPGTVVIPSCVGLAEGERYDCDAELVAVLTSAARGIGHAPVHGTLLTTSALVTGADRDRWAKQGFVAVDMESATLLGRRMRGAVVRVTLDTAELELSTVWERPWSAIRKPRVWFEAMRLAIDAPRASYRAAQVVKRALDEGL